MTSPTTPPPTTNSEAGLPLPPPVVAPPKRSNGFATAAFIFGIIAWVPFGLILGILGLIRAKKVGGIGRALSWTGIVLSTLWIIAITAVLVVAAPSLNKVANPGCIAAENVLTQSQPKFEAASGDRAAFINELHTVINGLNDAASRSTNAAATAAITAVIKDHQEVLDGLENGQAPSSDLQDRLVADGTALDAACGRT